MNLKKHISTRTLHYEHQTDLKRSSFKMWLYIRTISTCPLLWMRIWRSTSSTHTLHHGTETVQFCSDEWICPLFGWICPLPPVLPLVMNENLKKHIFYTHIAPWTSNGTETVQFCSDDIRMDGTSSSSLECISANSAQVLREIVFWLLSNWNVYDRSDGFLFDYESNWIRFGSKSKGKLSLDHIPFNLKVIRKLSMSS